MSGSTPLPLLLQTFASAKFNSRNMGPAGVCQHPNMEYINDGEIVSKMERPKELSTRLMLWEIRDSSLMGSNPGRVKPMT